MLYNIYVMAHRRNCKSTSLRFLKGRFDRSPVDSLFPLFQVGVDIDLVDEADGILLSRQCSKHTHTHIQLVGIQDVSFVHEDCL